MSSPKPQNTLGGFTFQNKKVISLNKSKIHPDITGPWLRQQWTKPTLRNGTHINDKKKPRQNTWWKFICVIFRMNCLIFLTNKNRSKTFLKKEKNIPGKTIWSWNNSVFIVSLWYYACLKCIHVNWWSMKMHQCKNSTDFHAAKTHSVFMVGIEVHAINCWRTLNFYHFKHGAEHKYSVIGLNV